VSRKDLSFHKRRTYNSTIMEKSISTDKTPDNIAKVIEVLTETPKKLEVLNKSMSTEKLRQPLGRGERSFTEDMAHMLNGEARSSEMIYQALLADEPSFANIHPERDWGKQRKKSVYWRARTIAMHELDHLGDLERKLKLPTPNFS